MDVATQAGPAPYGAAPSGAAVSTQAGSFSVSGIPAALNWTVEIDAMLKRLDVAEASLGQLVPVVEKTKRKRTVRRRQSKRGEIGDNYPPGAIGALPLDVPQITEGIDAIEVLRTELRSAAPRWDVIRICGYVIKRLASAAGTFGEAFLATTAALAANAAFATLQPTLIEITEQDWTLASRFGYALLRRACHIEQE